MTQKRVTNIFILDYSRMEKEGGKTKRFAGNYS